MSHVEIPETGIVPDHVVAIAVDDEVVSDDGSSVSGHSIASSSTSIAASILDYRQENGRTYHAYKDGKYHLPNDERENDRLDLQHNLFLLTFDDKLGNAPPNDPGSKVGRVLDLGAGTGIWAIEFGEEHPEAEVLGMDLSASFPEFTPPNVRFEVDDFEEEWTYSRPFDYIHSRMLNGCVQDWDVYVKKCFDNLTPGGYAEFIETNMSPVSDDGTLRDDSMIMKTVRLLQDASNRSGRPAQDMKMLRDVLVRAGFVDVKLIQHKWPINPWPKDPRHKEIGLWSHENIVPGYEALCLTFLTRSHGWTRDEVLVAMAQVRKEFRDLRIHAYYPLFSVYGRKPTEKETAPAA